MKKKEDCVLCIKDYTNLFDDGKCYQYEKISMESEDYFIVYVTNIIYKIICDDFKWYDKHIIDWIDQKFVFASEKEILQNLLDLRKQADKLAKGDYTDEDGKEVTYEVLLKGI